MNIGNNTTLGNIKVLMLKGEKGDPGEVTEAELLRKLDDLRDEIDEEIDNFKNVTPEQFGAVGDGVADDANAFNQAFSILEENDVIYLTDDKLYKITQPVRIEKPIKLVGAPNAVIKFVGDGCFLISNPEYDETRNYQTGDGCINPPGAADPSVVYELSGSNTWLPTTVPSRDKKGSEYSGNTSIFESVVFGYCEKVFTGKLIYLYFIGCKIHHCNTVFYCEGENDAKPAAWFGKIDLTDCDIRYNRELFYLSDNHFNGNFLSLNAVNINGGVVNSCNFFYQTPTHNYNKVFRVESMCLNGCDIENSDYFMAVNTDPTTSTGYIYNELDSIRTPWIGGLYLYNVVFQTCHIEQFRFLYHGYNTEISSIGLIRSQVVFDNCYIQSSNRRLIECLDDTNMAQGTYQQTTLVVYVINCPMIITARATGSGQTIGNYLLDQPAFPIIKMKHPRYSVVFENYARNALVNIFNGSIPTDTDSLTLSYGQLQAIGQPDITTANVDTVASIIMYPLACKSDIENILPGKIQGKNYPVVKANLLAATQTDRQQILTVLVNNTTVSTVGEYLDNNTAPGYVEAQLKSFNLHTSSSIPAKAYYNGTHEHTIGNTNRIYTTFIATKTNFDFLNQLPNGTIVTFDAERYSSDVYMVINTEYGVQVLNLVNAKDQLYYLVLSDRYNNQDMRYRTDFRNCLKLERVEIRYTPTENIGYVLPRELFQGCNVLADIYVPWTSTDTELNANAPYTNTSGVKVHFSDATYIYTGYGDNNRTPL